jgi:multiple sugar transport system ATP-binding protein
MKVVLQNLTKIFPSRDKKAGKEVVAVNDFTFEIPDGKLIGLLGPSGCGKSTTLYMISGLQKPTSGKIFFGEDDVTELSTENRGIGLVFQNYALYPHMTVYDNMAFALKMAGKPKDQIKQAVMEAAEILDITQYLRRKPKALSGGQRQRVAIGRAIVRDPQVMLMDEPLSNLDAKLRNQMRAEIIKLRQKINTTFIYVTHDQTEAMTLGDRIVIMKDGFIQQIGTPQEVFNHPYNLFVAGFIGMPQMNFFDDAKLVIENGKYAVSVGGMTVELSEEKQAKLSANKVAAQDIVLGVRPEHITLEKGLSGVVDVSELMGSSVHLHVNALGRDVVVVVSTMNMTGAEVEALSTGAALQFNFPGHCCHVFNKETGVNLEA